MRQGKTNKQIEDSNKTFLICFVLFVICIILAII